MAAIWGPDESMQQPRTYAQHVGDWVLITVCALGFAICFAGSAGWF